MADLFDSIGSAIGGVGKTIGQGLSALNPSNIRQSIAGFTNFTGVNKGNKGATSLTGISPSKVASDKSEWRVSLRDDDDQLVSKYDTLAPLKKTFNGVVFPYTPQITMTYRANYEMVHGIQTNYAIPTYTNSDVDTISVRANFTANNSREAVYVLAMLHFLRSATKSHMGSDPLAGVPPPILYLYGYGEGMFQKVPVVIMSLGYSLPADTDYISCGKFAQEAEEANTNQALTVTRDDEGNILPGAEKADAARIAARKNQDAGLYNGGFGITRVPTSLDIDLSLKVIYKRSDLTTLSTESYYSGDLVKQGWL